MSKPSIVQNIQPVFFVDPGAVSLATNQNDLSGSNHSNFSLSAILAVFYLLGMLSLFFRAALSYIKVKFEISNTISSHKDVVITRNQQVFTIFPKIFIPQKYTENSDLDSILIHERAHISQFHILDLVLAEITLLLTWFNPFSWLISRMIKENHEHLADRAVLSKGVKPAHYKALLLNHAMGGQVFRLGHQFNHSLTKKRFDMMKKMKASKKGMLKYLILIPAILAFTLLATATAQNTKTIHGKVYLEKEGDVAVGASVVIASSTIGTVVDMDGNFTLEVEGNPEIVISFVGYESARKTAKEIMNKPVILTRSTYEILLDDVYPDEENAETRKNEEETNTVNSDKQGGDQPIFYVVEDMPSFPGGKTELKKYLENNLKYPQKAQEENITGTVYVTFIVGNKGEIQDVRATKSPNDLLKNAAIDVIEKMPDWSPGKQRGKAVKVQVTIPIWFELDKE
jgi:TonB family protein